MNNRGVVLLITLVAVALVMILGGVAFYMSQTATRTTGLYRNYAVGLQSINAAYEETKYIVDYVKVTGGVPTSAALDCSVVGTNFVTKVLTPTSSGSIAWQGDAQDPDTVVSSPDIVCSSLGDYNVYVKLINTSEGNTATGRKRGLNASGVTTGKSGGSVISLPRVPYLYDFVIEAVNKTIPVDNMSAMVLYGY